MRIPLYICIPLALCLFGGLLWFGAHDTDFTTEPSETEIASSLIEWKEKNPPLPNTPSAAPTPTILAAAPETSTEEKSAEPQIPQIPNGDLETSPALDHYTQLSDYTAASYQQLAIELESLGKLQHSLLAWERSIDHVENESPSTAHKAIEQLRNALPIWQADSEDNLPITLHIHTPEIYAELIAPLKEQLALTLRNASSYLIDPSIQITPLKPRSGFPESPIRIWLSSDHKEPKQTPQLTFRFKPEDDSFSLVEQLYLAIYRSITGHFLQIDDIQTPANILPQDTAKFAIETYITRLHWKKLHDSLFTAPEAKPPAVIIIEEEGENE